MSPLYAGCLCTLLLSGAAAALLGCMSAARCRKRLAFSLCLAMTALNFAPLAALLARLPDCEALSPAPWSAALLLTAPAIAAPCVLLFKGRRQLSPVSIKESCDHLPCALCFALESGQPCLKNLKMDELSHQITGEALLNADTFWRAIEAQPIVTLSDGQTWSFERVRMDASGERVYQITGTNITEEARLQRELEKDNLRLKAMNRRLMQYGSDVQEATREREVLRAKTRIHDEIGHTLLQTRRFLSGAQGGAESFRAAWRDNTRLLLGKYVSEQRADAFEQLTRAAQAIGVSIERSGAFPADDTENAQLAEAAAHECLTNLVRHAGGARLEIFGEDAGRVWKIHYRNDGAAPSGPIVEGSGLTALRTRVEAAGGAMEIAHAPRFHLTLILPHERQEPA